MAARGISDHLYFQCRGSRKIPRANSFVQASAQDPAFVCLHGNHPDAWGMGGWKRKKMNKEEQQKRQPTIERQRE
eukprot:2177296-Rhodomonas_salina.4